MAVPEPECVAWKRLGAAHVAKLLAGKDRQGQLKFWLQRTERLVANKDQNQSDIN